MNACNNDRNDDLATDRVDILTRDSSQSSCSNNEKVANTIEADESHKLLMQLDDDDDDDVDDDEQIENNDKCTSRNQANCKSGHNDIIEFDLTNALVSPTNPFRLDFIQFERCRSNGQTEKMRTIPNNDKINDKNVNEYHPDSVNRNDSMKINEFVHLANGKKRYNDIKYQRNAKSLGYLLLCKRIECNCNCNPITSCKCQLQGNSLDLRRSKSSTGINHCKWSNEFDDDENENENDDRTNSDETHANFNANENNSSDNSIAANNGKFRKISITNKSIHSQQLSANGSANRKRAQDFREMRESSLKLSPKQKRHFHRMEKTAEIKTDPVNCDTEINAKHRVDGIKKMKTNTNNLPTMPQHTKTNADALDVHKNNSNAHNNEVDIFSFDSTVRTTSNETSVLKQHDGEAMLTTEYSLLAHENRNSDDNEQHNRNVSINEARPKRNIEHDLMLNATKASTNPFLGQRINVAESRFSKNENGKEFNHTNNGDKMERCEPGSSRRGKRSDKIHASNDVEETISNQFIANDDTISTKPTCKSERLNTSAADSERNAGENAKRDLYYNESSCLSRTKHRQKHDQMPSNNLLESENDNDDDNNQWDAVPNRSATLMKYGNKKRHRKDSNKECHKLNRSTDNLSLIDATGQHHARYTIERDGSRNKTRFYDKNLKYHMKTEINPHKNLNYFNKFDQQMNADDMQNRQPISYSSYTKNQRQIMSAISDIPTCPFQRQDYTITDNENPTDTNRTQKRSKKDLLLSFALEKGKCLTNTISRNGSNNCSSSGSGSGSGSGSSTASHCDGIRKTGNYIKTVSISNSRMPGGATRTLTNATTITHVSGKDSYLKKLNAGYANRLVASSNAKQHSFHFRHKDDKTYFDKTKKSLLKIGQKCGLKLNNSLSGSVPPKKYESSSLREPLTATDRDDGSHRYSSNANRPTIVEKVPYKSYRSEMDLTKNLHYLDAFLNENFDKLSKPKDGSHSIGKCSMASSSAITRERKSLNTMAFNDFQNRGHHRTQSVSEMPEFDGIDDTYNTVYRNAAAAALLTDEIATTMEKSLENNYIGTMGTMDTIPSRQVKREFLVNSGTNSSVGYRTPSITDNLNSIGQHHQSNQYVISSSTSESFSFKQPQSLPNQSPNQCNSSNAQSSQKFKCGKDLSATNMVTTTNVLFATASSCERSAKSQTTSSSLSSSDYASVYSPSSEKHYQAQAAMAKLNNELSFKQKRYRAISAPYQKRNSCTGVDLFYDDRSTAGNYLSDTRPLNCIDGLGSDIAAESDSNDDDDDNDDEDDDDDGDGNGFADENVPNNFNDFNECGNYAGNISQSDKLQLLEKSLYQYENKLPYHEDYLQHYYSKSALKRMSTSSASMQIDTSIASATYPYSQESQLNYAQSTTNLPSSSTQSYYAQEVTIRKQPNYPQNRVVITKQKSNRSNTNDIVLEYEC